MFHPMGLYLIPTTLENPEISTLFFKLKNNQDDFIIEHMEFYIECCNYSM